MSLDLLCRRRYNLAAPGGLVAPSPAGRGGLDGVEGAGRLRLCIRSVSHPGAGLGVSGQYVRRDETCPVSTGGTRRFQLVQGGGGGGDTFLQRDGSCALTVVTERYHGKMCCSSSSPADVRVV